MVEYVLFIDVISALSAWYNWRNEGLAVIYDWNILSACMFYLWHYFFGNKELTYDPTQLTLSSVTKFSNIL